MKAPAASPYSPRTINALLFLLLAPASAGAFCVGVEVAGRPLPSGSVVLSTGPSECVRVRLRDGRACFDGAAPGAYRLKVLPLNWQSALAVDVPRLGALDALSLSIEADGRFALRDARGRVARRGTELALVQRPLGPAASSTLDARVRFGKNPDPEASRPALLAVRLVKTAAGGDDYRFAWLDARPEGGESAARLAMPPGRLQRLELEAPGWAVLSARWSYDTENSLSTQTVAAFVSAGPGVLVRGRALSPGGAAFKPGFCGQARDPGPFFVEFVGPLDDGASALVDEDGGYEARVAPGPWSVGARYRGAEVYSWVAEPLFAMVPASTTHRQDVPVPHRDAGLRIAPEPKRPEELESVVPLMSRDSAGASGFCAISARRWIDIFLHPDGRWLSDPKSDLVSLEPGSYDLYRIPERGGASGQLTIAGSLKGVRLESGKVVRLEGFPADRTPRPAEFSARMHAPPLAGPEDLRAVRSMAEFCSLLLPSVSVFAADGRPLAFAGALQSRSVQGRILDALRAGRDDELRALLDPGTWIFRVTDLPAARVRAVFSAGNLPPRSVELDLSRPVAPLTLDFTAGRSRKKR